MSSNGSDASRWATPQRRWHRPTWQDVTGSLCWLLACAGTLLVITGDPDALWVGTGSMLASTVGSYYRTTEPTPYAKRFSHPPDAPIQSLVHDSVSQEKLPADPTLRNLALNYANGWTRLLKRGLRTAALAVCAWCLACGLLVWLLDRPWPESTPTRSWGCAITLTGALCWLLNIALPGLRRLHRLRRLHQLP